MRLGQFAGIQIGIHYSWYIIFLIIVYSLNSYFQGQYADWGTTTTLLTAITASLLFFASIVLHELGHSIVAIARGIPVQSITLFLFGGVAQTKKDSDSATSEFLIAIAGPLVSFLLAALFYGLSLILGTDPNPANRTAHWLAQVNLVVAVFNLLPGFPLDGGRIFRAIIWYLTGKQNSANKWSIFGGKAIAAILAFFGFWVGVQTQSMLDGIWFIALGGFLYFAAKSYENMYKTRDLLDNTRVKNFMRQDVPNAEAGLTVSEWIDHYLLAGWRSTLVHKDGKTIGLISLSDCIKHTRTDWTRIPISAVMTPIEKILCIDIDTPVMGALAIMREHGFNQIPVTKENQLCGWIERRDLLEKARF